jgi:hypothetical protein
MIIHWLIGEEFTSGTFEDTKFFCSQKDTVSEIKH